MFSEKKCIIIVAILKYDVVLCHLDKAPMILMSTVDAEGLYMHDYESCFFIIIHLLIFYANYLLCVLERLKPIPADRGCEAEYTLEKATVIHTHLHTYRLYTPIILYSQLSFRLWEETDADTRRSGKDHQVPIQIALKVFVEKKRFLPEKKKNILTWLHKCA